MECTIEKISVKPSSIHSKDRFRIPNEHIEPSHESTWLLKEENTCQRAITIPAKFWLKHFEYESSIKFDSYYQNWIDETLLESNGAKIVQNENYQKIIELGYSVIPRIIEKYRASHEHWSYALRKITGIDNGESELDGDLSLIRNQWLIWAEENEY